MVEAEWDDATRFKALGLNRYEADCCSGCGLHKSILDNPDENVFTFEQHVCPVCAAQDTYGRIVADEDRQAVDALGKDPDPKTARPDDGRSILMRRMTPDEIAARRTAGATSPSAARSPKSPGPARRR